MTDANETTRQDVKEKATQKFVRGDRHLPLLSAMRIVLIPERHLAVFVRDQPMIRDRDAVRVPGEILQDVFRPAERPLRVPNPDFPE